MRQFLCNFMALRKMPLKRAGLFALALLACFCGALAYNKTRDVDSTQVRMPASNYMRALDDRDYAVEIENAGDGQRSWAIRGEAAKNIFESEFIWAAQFVLDAPAMVAAALAPASGVTVAARERTPHLLAPIFDNDGASMPGLYAALPFDYQDPLDMEGRPVRWLLPEHRLIGYSLLPPPKPPVKEEPAPPPRPLPRMGRLSVSARASHYRELVENFAKKYNLNASLVMAIIHSESDFSPALVSNKSAMGLMQLLPSTASGEVHKFLYGRRGQVSFNELRIPEINIRYGTAYLHILLNRYFSNVKNRDVREACAIASYNLGPNRFLRLYGRTNEQAVENINDIGEAEFYNDLQRRLPARETRFFVQKVIRMKNHYSALSQAASEQSAEQP